MLVAASTKTTSYYNNPTTLLTASSESGSNIFGMETLMSYVPIGKSYLNKAFPAIDLLMKGFPDVLKNIDASFKSDVKKVNGIILEVCKKEMSETGPTTNSYFSQEGMKSTCDSITNITKKLSQGLDDPSIAQSAVENLKQYSNSLQESVNTY